MEEFKNGVMQRYYFCMDIRLQSPLCVASGESEYTDMDVARDFNGEPFVSGTSLAGAFRNYLSYSEENEEQIDRLFGHIKDQDSLQSRFSFSDLTFEYYTMSIRNRSKLEQKVAVTGAKYDMEIIEKEAEGKFYIEIELRENDIKKESGNDSDDLECAAYRFLKKIVFGINSGEITLGSNKSSGFGYFSIEKIYGKGFGIEIQEYNQSGTYHNLRELFTDKGLFFDFSSWLEFDRNSLPDDKNIVDWNTEKFTPFYTTLNIPLKLNSTINIRQYLTKYDTEDNSTHIFRITKDKKEIPIIPGSSWKGAIRSQCESILEKLKCIQTKEQIQKMFGFVEEDLEYNQTEEEKDREKASVSSVFFEESDIIACDDDTKINDPQSGHYLSVTRNQINRFTGGTVTHALLHEKVYVYGTCSLVIHIRKNIEKNRDKNLWMVKLLLLAIKDLQNGYLAIGGETGIGRGIFSPNYDDECHGAIKIFGINSEDEQKQLAEYWENLEEKREGERIAYVKLHFEPL